MFYDEEVVVVVTDVLTFFAVTDVVVIEVFVGKLVTDVFVNDVFVGIVVTKDLLYTSNP